MSNGLYSEINLYFQDESRFGLKTHTGRCLTARGVKPIVNYQHKFKSTYLWGSYSPIDGDSFVWEIDGVNCQIFEKYLNALSKHRPEQLKILVIDNAGFHSTKNIIVPANIYLLNIPAYCPELNPCEQVWQYIKHRFKNKIFNELKQVKQWLHQMVKNMKPETIKSITSNHHYTSNFYQTF